jgi:hypothetical protein
MPTTVRIVHASQQFSDSRVQQAHDVDAVFGYADRKGALFLTGTESGGDSLRTLVTKYAKQYGWALSLHRTGDWVALNRDLAKVDGKGFDGPHIPGTTGLKASEGAHAPRGIAWITGTLPGVGSVTMGCVHYLTARSMKASGTTNEPLARGLAAWGRDKGKGKAIAFVGGDFNMDDANRDVFLGKPFTTCWDELRKYPATYGTSKARGRTIDVIASYDADRRVKAKAARVLDDSDLRLNTDHFLIEATYTVVR